MLRQLAAWCCPTDEPKEKPYDMWYPLDTGDIFETPQNLADGLVEELTPDGRVRMRFTDGVFEYWADRAVTYRFLETVARKYVIVFNCREHYVNMFRERLKALDAQAVRPAPNPVFATLKRHAASREAPTFTAANRYRWLGKHVETKAPRGMRYSEFKKQI